MLKKRELHLISFPSTNIFSFKIFLYCIYIFEYFQIKNFNLKIYVDKNVYSSIEFKKTVSKRVYATLSQKLRRNTYAEMISFFRNFSQNLNISLLTFLLI